MITIPDEVNNNVAEYDILLRYKGYIESIIIPNNQAKIRIDEMAQDIWNSYRGDSVLLLCVLRGAFKFTAKIIDALERINLACPPESYVRFNVEFIRASSYFNDKSLGFVKVFNPESLECVRNRNVLIVEDIVDTGKTITKLKEVIAEYEPKSLKLANFLSKRLQTPTLNGDFVGFSIPNRFVVGNGFEYNGYFWDLPHCAFITDAAVEELKIRK